MKISENWQVTEQGNVILEREGFYISYNSMVDTYSATIPCFTSDEGMDETALCSNRGFFILNGDFRQNYEALVDQGFDACYEFYLVNQDKCGSSWSTKTPLSSCDDEE